MLTFKNVVTLLSFAFSFFSPNFSRQIILKECSKSFLLFIVMISFMNLYTCSNFHAQWWSMMIKWRLRLRSGVFIVNFEHISHLLLVFLLLTLNKWMLAGIFHFTYTFRFVIKYKLIGKEWNNRIGTHGNTNNLAKNLRSNIKETVFTMICSSLLNRCQRIVIMIHLSVVFIQFEELLNTFLLPLVPSLNANSIIAFNTAKSFSWDILMYVVEKLKSRDFLTNFTKCFEIFYLVA